MSTCFVGNVASSAMSQEELSASKVKDTGFRWAKPRTKAKRKARAIIAESEDLLAAVREIVREAEAIPEAEPARLAVFRRRLDRIESDRDALYLRAVAFNAAVPNESRVDISPAGQQQVSLILNFHLRYPLDSASSPAVSTPPSDIASLFARVPQLTFPTFSGHYLEWPPFRNFVEGTLLRDAHGPEFLRYAALCDALVGEPRRFVAFAAQMDTCFSTAWRALLDRHDRPRYSCNALLDELFDLSPVTTTRPAPIQALIWSIKQIVQVLHYQLDLSAEVGPHSRGITRLALRKVPASLRMRFELSHTSPSPPTFTEVLDFFQRYCSARGVY